jgi:hypothetical protein
LRRFETAKSGFDGSKPGFGHEIAVRRYRIGRSGSSAVSFSASLTKARLIRAIGAAQRHAAWRV